MTMAQCNSMYNKIANSQRNSCQNSTTDLSKVNCSSLLSFSAVTLHSSSFIALQPSLPQTSFLAFFLKRVLGAFWLFFFVPLSVWTLLFLLCSFFTVRLLFPVTLFIIVWVTCDFLPFLYRKSEFKMDFLPLRSIFFPAALLEAGSLTLFSPLLTPLFSGRIFLFRFLDLVFSRAQLNAALRRSKRSINFARLVISNRFERRTWLFTEFGDLNFRLMPPGICEDILRDSLDSRKLEEMFVVFNIFMVKK